MRKCRIFVSIPGSPFFERLYKNAIKPIESDPRLDLDVFSSFDRPPFGNFSGEIHLHIAFSNIVVAVASGSNPNVLYEIGLAVGNGKPIVPMTDSVDGLPAMIKHINAVRYDADESKWGEITRQLADRCYGILIGDYMEQRHKTHIALLVQPKSAKKTKKAVTRSERTTKDALGRAAQAYEAKDYDGVIRILEPLVHQGLAAQRAIFYLTDACFLRGESLPEGEKKYTYYRKQLQAALLGAEKFPQDQDITKNLGLAYLKLRELDRARQVFAELLKSDPDYAVARYNLACIHAQKGDLDGCSSELARLFERDPTWRSVARVDPDFEPLWHKDRFQRLLYPIASPYSS
jgi:tetratricopeptide (TPR) repeat protein